MGTNKKAFIKDFCKGVLSMVGISALLFLAAAQLDFDIIGYGTDEVRDVIGENCSFDARIVDIAMLGSHDAFSNQIRRGSPFDPNASSAANNGFIEFIAGGLVKRMCKAQELGCYDQLCSGIRYFDVRVCEYDDTFYTVHERVSGPLRDYVQDAVDFLDEHPSEFIIFDIQHFDTDEGRNSSAPVHKYEELFDYLDSIKNQSGKSLLDYANYDANTDALGELTYGSLTNNGTEGGALILAKCENFPKVYTRDGDASFDENRNYHSVRSYWHDTNSEAELLKGIEKEYEFVKTHDYSSYLRINQAQLTGFNLSDLPSIFRMFGGWSLLDMAGHWNYQLLEEGRLDKWLDQMPILMVDYATTDLGRFNVDANKIIAKFNQEHNQGA